MRSHFLPPPEVTAACAVASALAMLGGNCSAQTLIAADYATNSTYATSWAAGQNGGHGFGAWSFDGTNPLPPGQYEGISTLSALGTAWTLATYDNHSGLADVGRAIPGGLKPGQTFQAVIQNPLGYHFFRGFDFCCFNGTNNNPGGVNTAALRMQVFNYFAVTAWRLDDTDGDTITPIDSSTSGSAGMKFDLTLTSTNTYSITMTPLSNPSAAYTQAGTLITTNLPINWINLRLYYGTSSGLSDTTNNFEISSMTISGLTLNIQKAGADVLLSWPTNVPLFSLESTTNLGAAAIWNPVSPVPSVVNGQNVVTNPIAATQQFYRLRLSQ